ncbi:MAG: FG-GAP repeat protein, partial [Deltaproteobacteria bacterium]|nr:FG-GAP repeat protein [Deltaproteobacteria bacterium]
MGQQSISFERISFLSLAFVLAVFALSFKAQAELQRRELSSVRQVRNCSAGFPRPRSLSDLIEGFDLKALSLKGLSQTFLLNCADARFVGESTGDSAGQSVSGIGDINGDGFDDLLIGVPQESSEYQDGGAAYLFLGPVQGTLDLSQADLKFVGQRAGDIAGTVVARAGDVNADGFSDFLIGAPAFYDPTGHVYLFYGDPNFMARFSEPVVSLGDADVVIEGGWGTGVVAGAGDVNG